MTTLVLMLDCSILIVVWHIFTFGVGPHIFLMRLLRLSGSTSEQVEYFVNTRLEALINLLLSLHELIQGTMYAIHLCSRGKSHLFFVLNSSRHQHCLVKSVQVQDPLQLVPQDLTQHLRYGIGWGILHRNKFCNLQQWHLSPTPPQNKPIQHSEFYAETNALQP